MRTRSRRNILALILAVVTLNRRAVVDCEADQNHVGARRSVPPQDAGMDPKQAFVPREVCVSPGTFMSQSLVFVGADRAAIETGWRRQRQSKYVHRVLLRLPVTGDSLSL